MILDVPNFQVVGTSCEKVLFLMEYNWTYRHSFVFGASDLAEGRVDFIDSC